MVTFSWVLDTYWDRATCEGRQYLAPDGQTYIVDEDGEMLPNLLDMKASTFKTTIARVRNADLAAFPNGEAATAIPEWTRSNLLLDLMGVPDSDCLDMDEGAFRFMMSTGARGRLYRQLAHDLEKLRWSNLVGGARAHPEAVCAIHSAPKESWASYGRPSLTRAISPHAKPDELKGLVRAAGASADVRPGEVGVLNAQILSPGAGAPWTATLLVRNPNAVSVNEETWSLTPRFADGKMGAIKRGYTERTTDGFVSIAPIVPVPALAGIALELWLFLHEDGLSKQYKEFRDAFSSEDDIHIPRQTLDAFARWIVAESVFGRALWMCSTMTARV